MVSSFLELKGGPHAYDQAKTVILPIPYECSTSYITGTKHGPGAILNASPQLEEYDTELEKDVVNAGVYTAPPLDFSYRSPEEDLAQINHATAGHLSQGKWLLSLGGEHTISVPLFQAHHDYHDGQIGLVHLDAHFDLRQEYEGSIWSHACVLRRIREQCSQTLSLGIRAYSEEEALFAKEHRVTRYRDVDLYHNRLNLDSELDCLPDSVYLTIDLDFFSPNEFPGLGTPVPGGPTWWEGLSLIRRIFEKKNVVGADIVELCPLKHQERSEFSAALLALKCIAYKHHLKE